MRRVLQILLGALIVVTAAVFSAINDQVVTINFFGEAIECTLGMALFVLFIGGFMIGYLVACVSSLRKRMAK